MAALGVRLQGERFEGRDMNALTTARIAAERLYEARPTMKNLRALKVAGEAEMNAYLAGFDKRQGL